LPRNKFFPLTGWAGEFADRSDAQVAVDRLAKPLDLNAIYAALFEAL